MGWFSKKKKEGERKPVMEPMQKSINSPTLPPLPKLPEIQSIKQNISPPKGALNSPPHIEKQNQPKMITAPPTTISPVRKETGPIFVKIDKFKDASNNFEKIKEKVEDIEEMLEKIKDIKQKEDQELKEWEHEVQVIKTRVGSIDDSLFKKL